MTASTLMMTLLLTACQQNGEGDESNQANDTSSQPTNIQTDPMGEEDSPLANYQEDRDQEDEGIYVEEENFFNDESIISLHGFLDTQREDFSYYTHTAQNQVQEMIDDFQTEDYTVQEPLLIENPYGTINNGLYVYFTDDQIQEVEYTINVDNPEMPDFTQTAVNYGDPGQGEMEFLVIGLVPGEENQLTLIYKDENGNTVEEVQETLEVNETTPESYGNQLEVHQVQPADHLAEGMFITMGAEAERAGFQYLLDNHGVVRAEFSTDTSRFENVHRFSDDEIIFGSSGNQFSTINGLGQVTNFFVMDNHRKHHDFILTEDGSGLLILASDLEADTIEDVIYYIDVESGEGTQLIDLKESLASYYEQIEHPEDEDQKLDWTHINSIDIRNEDEIVLSSREMSTIIKMSNIFDAPQVDYLIGQPEFWQGSGYEDLLLDQVEEFPYQAGQHTVFFEEGDDLPDHQYYLGMYNNNYWRATTRPDYDGPIPSIASTDIEYNEEDRSYHYQYVVDEQAGTVDLVDQVEVPYSSIVSSSQRLDNGNILTNSGMANILIEHDENGEVIHQYHYDLPKWSYRIHKEDFSGVFYQ